MSSAERRSETSQVRGVSQTGAFSGSGEGTVPQRSRVRALPDSPGTPNVARSRRSVSVRSMRNPVGEVDPVTLNGPVTVRYVEPKPNSTAGDSRSDLNSRTDARGTSSQVEGARMNRAVKAIFPDRDAVTTTGSEHASTGEKRGLTEEEFLKEFEDRRGDVYGTALRLMGNPHDAEDLLQDTFLRAWNGRKGYDDGNVGGWLHKICVHRGLDIHRRRTRMSGVLDTTDQVPEPHEAYAGTQNDPTKFIDVEAVRDQVQGALSQIPKEFATAVHLYDGETYTYAEIADMTNVSMGTVRSRIHRGRARLRKVFDNTSQDEK